MADTYTIVKGDTLSRIARRFGVSLADLIAANPQIKNPDLIFIGDTLTIPGQGDQPAAEQPADQAPAPSTPPPPQDTSPAPPPLRTEEQAPGVWDGGRILRVQIPNQDDRWFMEYEWNGKRFLFQFDSMDQISAVIGDGWYVDYPPASVDPSYLNEAVEAGPVSQVTGPGSFRGFMDETVRRTLAEAGVTDPTMVGRYLSSPEISDILVSAALGDWSEAQTRAAIRGTDFYRNVLYPGIEQFFGFEDPEARWREYARAVGPGLEVLGYQRDQDGSYREAIGQMLNAGVGELAWQAFVPAFVKAKNNVAYANILDQWTQRDLGKSLDFEQWFDVVAGAVPADLAETVEKATLAFEAQQQGVQVSDQQIERIASLSDLDQQAAAAVFQDVASTLRAVGEKAGLYGVTLDDVVSAIAGIEADGMRSLEEIKALVSQAAREQGLADDEKITFFTNFSPQGTPQKIGLRSLAPEGS